MIDFLVKISTLLPNLLAKGFEYLYLSENVILVDSDHSVNFFIKMIITFAIVTAIVYLVSQILYRFKLIEDATNTPLLYACLANCISLIPPMGGIMLMVSFAIIYMGLLLIVPTIIVLFFVMLLKVFVNKVVHQRPYFLYQ